MRGLGLDSPEACEHLDRVLRIVDVVQEVIEAAPQTQPEPGSKLEKLAQEFDNLETIKVFPTLQFSLHQAFGALGSIRTLLRADEEKFIPAIQSLLRTATLASARVIWTLSDDDYATCQERLHRIMGEELRNLSRAAEESSHFHVLMDVAAQPRHIDAIDRDLDTYGRLQRLFETDLLIEFSQDIEKNMRSAGNDPRGAVSEFVMWLWKTSSSYAHGMGWTHYIGASNANGAGDFVADFSMVASFAHTASDVFLRASTNPVRTSLMIGDSNNK